MTDNTSTNKVVKIRESIRKRPSMYIGETNRVGLHYLIKEIFDNSVDEALKGYCTKIEIIFHPEDNSIEIADNGNGIPVDINPETEMPLATMIYTGLCFSPLHGIGATVTNSLSAYLELNIKKDGKVYYQRFEKGIPIESLKFIRDMNPEEECGTIVRFSPDIEMFPEALEEEGGINLRASYIKDYIEIISYLVKKLHINLIDESGEKTQYYSEKGISDLVSKQTEIIASKIQNNINEDGNLIKRTLFDENIYFNAKDEISSVEVCFNYVNKSSSWNILSFANHIHTKQGGTHVNGFEMALKKVLVDYIVKNKEFEPTFTTEDIKEGINLVISFSTPEPKFCDAVKQKLSTVAGQKLTYSASEKFLETFLDKNPILANLWIDKIMIAQRMREKFEKEQQKARKKT